MRERDHAGRVLVLPNQSPGVLDRYGLTRSGVDEAAWAIDSGGQRLAGAAAINRVFGELGGIWRGAAMLYRLPLVRPAEDAFYRWFARNRFRFPWLGVTPECERAPSACE